MKLYVLIYPSDFSDTESHNQLMENIGDLQWKPLTGGAGFMVTDIDQPTLAKTLFANVDSSYHAMLFLVGDRVSTPHDLLAP
jgi:hypothetical protein